MDQKKDQQATIEFGWSSSTADSQPTHVCSLTNHKEYLSKAENTECIYRKTIQMLAGISAILLLIILFLHTSYRDPALFGKYSVKYFFSVIVFIILYLGSIALLVRTSLLRRTTFQNTLLLVLSLITTISLGELGFRISGGLGFVRGSEVLRYQMSDPYAPNSQYIYCGFPSQRKEFCVRNNNNSLGFNDKEYGLAKPMGIYRILIVGDSYVQAHEVNLENTFHKIIETKLNEMGLRVEVVAMGRQGLGTLQMESLVENGMRFNPDLVVLEFLGRNDVSDNSSTLSDQYRQARVALIPPAVKKSLLGRFDLAFFALDLIDRLYLAGRKPIATPLDVFDPDKYEFDSVWQQAWDNTFNSVLRIKNMAEEGGADFLLVSFTSDIEVSSYQSRQKLQETLRERYASEELVDHHDFQLPDKAMSNFSQQNGIHYLQLNRVFAEMKTQDKSDIQLHFFYDGHWNEQGHQVAAEVIFDQLYPSLVWGVH